MSPNYNFDHAYSRHECHALIQAKSLDSGEETKF